MIIIGKPINGISLNGDEYLLDEHGEFMEFDSPETAKQFLRDNGFQDFSDDEISDSFNFKERYPFNEGDSYWTIEPMADDAEYEDNVGFFQRGVTAIQSCWDAVSEELHTDDKQYFDSLEEVLQHCRYTYDFVKVECFDCDMYDINNGDYLVSDDEESGKFQKSY